LDRDFSIDDGDLTPTMKLKRNVVSEKLKQVIDKTY
jgi:long-chain acyl-CoA synthetase